MARLMTVADIVARRIGSGIESLTPEQRVRAAHAGWRVRSARAPQPRGARPGDLAHPEGRGQPGRRPGLAHRATRPQGTCLTTVDHRPERAWPSVSLTGFWGAKRGANDHRFRPHQATSSHGRN